MLWVTPFLSLLLSGPLVRAHISIWHPAIFGFNGTNNAVADYNNAITIEPLRKKNNLDIAQWFGHGFLDLPPTPNTFMELPAGGTFNAEVSCNRAFTTYQDPRSKTPPTTMACDSIKPLHTVNNFGTPPNVSLLGGCSLAIAYSSDENSVTPEDFTVFSVNHTCVWTRELDFQIPANMPACPEGGCLCTWNWIHTAGNYNAEGRGEGYGNEMYNVMARCNITNASNSTDLSVGKGTVAKLCDDNPDNCTVGAKVPTYWSQKSGNNNWDEQPPTYNLRYGFEDGAQNDIFVTANGTSITSSLSTNGTSSSSYPVTSSVASASAGSPAPSSAFAEEVSSVALSGSASPSSAAASVGSSSADTHASSARISAAPTGSCMRKTKRRALGTHNIRNRFAHQNVTQRKPKHERESGDNSLYTEKMVKRYGGAK